MKPCQRTELVNLFFIQVFCQIVRAVKAEFARVISTALAPVKYPAESMNRFVPIETGCAMGSCLFFTRQGYCQSTPASSGCKPIVRASQEIMICGTPANTISVGD